MSALEGILAPVLTPFTADLSPDPSRFIAHCRRLLTEGCHALAIFGTTSEANSLSLDERRTLLDQILEAGIDPGRLLVGTGCCALSDSVELTRHAARTGCAGALVLPPFYYKEVSDSGLFDAYRELIERVADDRLRVYLYNFPRLAGIRLSPELVARLREAFPLAVVGIKDSTGTIESLSCYLQWAPEFRVFCGTETLLIENLHAGGAGSITATANVNAPLLQRLYETIQKANPAPLLARILAVRSVLDRYPMIPALKSLVAHRDGDDAWRRVRPPLESLDPERMTGLLKELSTWLKTQAALDP